MSALELTPTQRRYLKQLAHPLKPLMQMGKEGPSSNFMAQLVEQLSAHELIKVRILGNCLTDIAVIKAALEAADVTFVQKVGHVMTVLKQKEEDSILSLPSK